MLNRAVEIAAWVAIALVVAFTLYVSVHYPINALR